VRASKAFVPVAVVVAPAPGYLSVVPGQRGEEVGHTLLASPAAAQTRALLDKTPDHVVSRKDLLCRTTRVQLLAVVVASQVATTDPKIGVLPERDRRWEQIQVEEGVALATRRLHLWVLPGRDHLSQHTLVRGGVVLVGLRHRLVRLSAGKGHQLSHNRVRGVVEPTVQVFQRLRVFSGRDHRFQHTQTTAGVAPAVLVVPTSLRMHLRSVAPVRNHLLLQRILGAVVGVHIHILALH
jgi:hypothetical protein